MAYTFRVTAKRDIAANGQRIGKGMVVQICIVGSSPGIMARQTTALPASPTER